MDDIGIIPCLLTSPTVGLNPTIPLTEAGQDIEPFVSVPIARSTEPDATATEEICDRIIASWMARPAPGDGRGAFGRGPGGFGAD